MMIGHKTPVFRDSSPNVSGRRSGTNVLRRWGVCRLALLVCLAVGGPLLAVEYLAEEWVWSGNRYFYSRDYGGAEKCYTIAIEKNADCSIAFNNRGLARYHRGYLAEAVADFNEARDLDPNYLAPYINMGKCLAAQKRFGEAETVLQQGLAHDANSPSLWYNLGWVYDEGQRLSDANDCYTKALSFDPNHHRAWIARGITRAKQGNGPRAESDFYYTINTLEARDIRRPMAAYNLQHARGPGVDFHDPEAAASFAEGVFLYATEQYRSARDLLKAAEANEPDVPEIPWMQFWTCVSIGHQEQAGAAWTRTRELQQRLIVDCTPPQAQTILDGMEQGIAPKVFFVFPSKYDLMVRAQDASGVKQEWTGPAYSEGMSDFDAPALRPKLTTVSEYTGFGPIPDRDRDGLADAWEERWFGHLNFTAEDDTTDLDGLPNLSEHWFRTDPTSADSDRDGIADADEVQLYGSDPNGTNTFYYVNDGDTKGDLWCSADGNDRNDGKTPASPKASVTALLAEHVIGPGSIICIDSGFYEYMTDIMLGAQSSGTREKPVILQGAGSNTILHRIPVKGSSCIALDQASHVIVRSLDIRGGESGICATSTENCRLDRCDLRYYSEAGVSVLGSNHSLEIRNLLADGVSHGGRYGVRLAGDSLPADDAGSVRIINCTLVANRQSGVSCESGVSLSLRNSILAASGLGASCLQSDRLFPSESFENNCYHLRNHASLAQVAGKVYATLLEWQTEMEGFSNDIHSIEADPLFASAGDRHLASRTGRFCEGLWLQDEVTSPCVDGGALDAPYDREPVPHGRRINLGRYGGTSEASKSDTGPK